MLALVGLTAVHPDLLVTGLQCLQCEHSGCGFCRAAGAVRDDWFLIDPRNLRQGCLGPLPGREESLEISDLTERMKGLKN